MKKKTVLIFLGLVCTAFLNAQSLDEMILTAAVRMSNDLPAGSTVAIVSVSAHSEELSAYVIDGLYGALLRNRRVTPVKFDRGQAQYAITGSIEVVGSEYRLSFNAVDGNAEIKSHYASSSTGTVVMAETGTVAGNRELEETDASSPEISSSIMGEDASSTGGDKNTSVADTSKKGQILALFGVGAQSLDHENHVVYEPTESVNEGITLGVNVLFVGKSGFTISVGIDTISLPGVGVNIDPVVGLGYVYNNKFYVGGIINLIPKPYITFDYIFEGNSYYGGRRVVDSWRWSDVFFTPTLVVGYDFGGHFLLGLQLSYMSGFASGINGFKFSVGTGVNIR